LIVAKRVIFEPGPGKVAVEPIGGDKQLETSGIWLLGGDRATLGIVIALYEPFTDPADGVETEPFFAIGDRVIFGKHSGVEVQFEKRRAIILKEAEILTKVREEEVEDAG
jgi:co-chaperonin GroES (HSP10)